jgi:3-phenylpropionate/cinnamic acid dioxygenase small subunit
MKEMSDEALKAQVKRLEATEEVRTLLFDYAYFLDMNYTKELAELFTDDCSVVYGPGFGAEGIDAYKKTLEGVGSYFSATSHHVSNVKVEFDNDGQARVRSVLYAWHRYRKERPDGILFGQYHDVVVKQGGKWQFKVRELRTSAVTDFHTKPEYQLPIGRRVS